MYFLVTSIRRYWHANFVGKHWIRTRNRARNSAFFWKNWTQYRFQNFVHGRKRLGTRPEGSLTLGPTHSQSCTSFREASTLLSQGKIREQTRPSPEVCRSVPTWALRLAALAASRRGRWSRRNRRTRRRQRLREAKILGFYCMQCRANYWVLKGVKKSFRVLAVQWARIS